MDSRYQKKNYRDGSYLLVDSLNDIVVETTFLTGSAHILTAGTMSPLLFFVPIAFISNTLQLPDAAIFLISLLGVASLAEKMGIITDQLVHHTNQTIGALLNVSFGNATELIVAIFALKRKLYRLVQLSLLGSILINILFVLGMCFFVGGMKQKVQNFSKISSHLNATLLVSSLMAILFPTVLTLSGEESNMGELGFSRLTSVVLLVTYFAFLYFQLVSHADLYENDCTSDYSPSVPSKHSLKCITSATSSNTYQHQQPSPDHSPVSNRPVVDARSSTSNDDEEPMEVKQLVTLPTCIVWLGATTILISLLSDLIASSIENAANDVNISGVFLAAVVLPFIGNTEIISSVKFAWRNKLDGSLGVAVGSSTQIALFHLPLLVVISWCMGLQMSLNFGAYETSTLLVSVIGAVFAIKDGTSNWMIGLIMIASYCIVAVGFFAHKNDSLSN